MGLNVIADLEPFLVSPSGDMDVVKGELFNITTGVTCTGSPCIGVVAKLDPQPAYETYIEYEVYDALKTDDTVEVMIVFSDEVYDIEDEKLKIKKGDTPDIVRVKKQKKLEKRKELIANNQDMVLSKLVYEQSTWNWIFSFRPDKFKLKYKFKTINAIAGEISREGLEMLQDDPDIKSITVSKQMYATLLEHTPLINADDFWNFAPNGSNIKGAGQTVCVVDTGINADHSGLGGRVVAEKCYCSIDGGCCPDASSESNDAEDDHGHGTHCAGIAAADYGAYQGAAPEAKIAAVKVLAASGSGSSLDVDAGIDWCVDNAAAYNITVISLSLGDGVSHSSVCDGEDPGSAAAINSAHSADIAVFVASGNDVYRNGIGSPACIANAISVGAVYDANVGGRGWSGCTDSSTAADQVTCFTNTADILDILAPGALTTSLDYAGTTSVKGGTSMACPMAAGAAALIKDFYSEKYGYDITPDEIKEKLINSGVPIDDPFTTRFYPRINMDEILEKGVIPELSNWNGFDPFYTISSNPRDSVGCLANISVGQNCTTTWTVNATKSGTWEFFTIYEEGAVQEFTPRFNVTVDIDRPEVSLLSPLDGFFLNPETISFNYSVNSSKPITRCRLLIGDDIISTDNTVTKGTAQTLVWYSPTGGTLSWDIVCTDSDGVSNSQAYEPLNIVIMDEFDGDSTNLSDADIENITNLIIEKSNYGKINFSGSINLSLGSDINKYVKFDKNKIEIDSSNLPTLNRSATLILYNISFSNPVIFRDNQQCDDCTIRQAGSDYVIFDVNHFTTYSVRSTTAEKIRTGSYNGTTSAGNDTAQGGNTTYINLSFIASTERWQGYYGNVSGYLTLGLSAYIFYNFGTATEFAVYATQNQSFDFDRLNSALAADVDAAWNYTSGADQAVDVFSGSTTNISGIVAPSVELNPLGQGFNSTILNDGNNLSKSSYSFGAIINKGGLCFDGSLCDFELLVPAEGIETYYMFLEVG